jgi:cytoskeletal protein CcmA (bactofilin family)
MFAKPKPATPQTAETAQKETPVTNEYKPTPASAHSTAPKAKPPASVLSADLTITGNVKTSGDIQVEGTVEGDIRAHLLTVGEGALVKGEVMADDVIVNGHVIGRVRGLKVRLTATAKVEGDIIHKTIAIESGAHFEGSVRRQDDPMNAAAATAKPAATPAAAPAAAQPQPMRRPTPAKTTA